MPLRFIVLRDSVYGANMVAANTAAGLVVVDNTMFRDITTTFLDSASRAFGHRRVAQLINTHGHDDHTWGNQIFADRGVPIAAHPATIEYMRRRIAEMRTFYERGPVVVSASRDSLGAADSVTAARLRSRIDRVSTNLRRHQDLRVTVPTMPVGRDTSWVIGGAQVAVLSIGRAHSEGDIAVLLPRHGIAVVGDLIGSDELPGLSSDGDLAAWVVALDQLQTAARNVGIRRVIPGHGPETTLERVACNRVYVDAVRRWAMSPESSSMQAAREASRCGIAVDSARHARNMDVALQMRDARARR